MRLGPLSPVKETTVAELGLPGLWSLTPIGALIGVLVLQYYLLSTGRLITKSSHEREIGIYQEQKSVDQETIKTQSEQLTSLLSVGRTVQAVLRHAGPDIDEDTSPVRGES